MFTAKIIDIKKDVYQHSQEPFLDVEVAILNDEGETVETKKYAYSIDTTEDMIVADVEKMLTLYKEEALTAEDEKAKAELHAKADETIDALKDAEISTPEEEDKPKKKGK